MIVRLKITPISVALTIMLQHIFNQFVYTRSFEITKVSPPTQILSRMCYFTQNSCEIFSRNEIREREFFSTRSYFTLSGFLKCQCKQTYMVLSVQVVRGTHNFLALKLCYTERSSVTYSVQQQWLKSIKHRFHYECARKPLKIF